MAFMFPWSTLKDWALLPAILVVIASCLGTQNARMELRPPILSNYTCPPNTYTTRIVSYSPLIIHLENFLNAKEREHLVSLGLPKFSPSLVVNKTGGGQMTQAPGRTSSSAYLDSQDPAVSCVRQRALQFQGYESARMLERLQVVKYSVGQEYQEHYDWGIRSEEKKTADRATTFFAILKGECEHCGTRFPYLNVDWASEDNEWCRIVDCELSSMENGTAFKAVEGSALFWRNLDDLGEGDNRVLHAGMKLKSGSKIGLNIWTRGE